VNENETAKFGATVQSGVTAFQPGCRTYVQIIQNIIQKGKIGSYFKSKTENASLLRCQFSRLSYVKKRWNQCHLISSRGPSSSTLFLVYSTVEGASEILCTVWDIVNL